LFFSYLAGHKRQVAAGVIEKDSKVLIARRRKKDTLGGFWEFPGGKVEPGEIPQDCLKRELKEEFDIETEIGELLSSTIFRYFFIPIELLAYRVRYISGDFKINEHDEIQWVLPEEFKNYNLVNADKPIAKAILTSKNTGHTI
jgi:8-oxo-dGTP diphosphatase